MSAINQDNLAVDLAFHGRMTTAQAQAAIRLLGELVVKSVSEGKAVELIGFGKFDLGKRGNGEPALRFRQANSVREALKS